MASKYDRLEEENAGVQVPGNTYQQNQPRLDTPYAPPGTPYMASAPPPPYSSTPVVTVCQAPAQTTIIRTVQAMPPTYMTMSILSCLFCCWPIGICAIIKSNEVSDHWASGNIQAANAASKDARQLGKVTMIVGGIMHGLWIALMIIYFAVLASIINQVPDY